MNSVWKPFQRGVLLLQTHHTRFTLPRAHPFQPSHPPQQQQSSLEGPFQLRRRSLFSRSLPRLHGEYEREPPKSEEEIVNLVLTDREGEIHNVQGKIGDNFLYLMHTFQEKNPKLFLEGACEASLACSTCHVIVDDEEYFDMLPEATEDEEDMLDMAACLTSTSRLGCQITLTKEMDGMKITLPKFSKNFYVDGHTPTPH